MVRHTTPPVKKLLYELLKAGGCAWGACKTDR